MKRTVQMKRGNVHSRNSVASIPRNAPLPRPLRRFLKATNGKTIQWPKWCGLPDITVGLLVRAGVWPKPEAAT